MIKMVVMEEVFVVTTNGFIQILAQKELSYRHKIFINFRF